MTGISNSTDFDPGDKIHWLTAEFITAKPEQAFREEEAPAQRRAILFLCMIIILIGVSMQIIFDIKQDTLSNALLATRVSMYLSLVFAAVAVIRRAHHRYLDISILIFGAMAVLQSALLIEIADPVAFSLLARNIAIVAFAHFIMPTRFIGTTILLLVQTIIVSHQILTYFHLDTVEQLSLITITLALFLAGTFSRWQREVSNRRRFRATSQRDTYLQQLSESEGKLRLVTDSLPIFIAYIDSDERVQYINNSGRDWYCLQGVDIIGRTLEELIPSDYKGAASFSRAALNGEDVHFERVVNYPDGKTRTVDVTHLPHFNVGGEVVGYFSQTVDMTDSKRTALDLNNARREAEAANRSKSEFMANMSHELRTPLNAVIGFSSAMAAGLSGELKDKQKEYIGDIQDSGEHLLSLINDLLDLSKIEAGKLEINPEAVNVDEQIERCLPFVKEQATKGQIRLNHTTAPDLPMLVADQRMLRQMIVNLLSNAVKFSLENGKVKIFALLESTGRITISISDDGPGMTAEDIPKALTPFVQTESSMIAGGGTGLGLSLVKGMMERHGGTLEIQSVVGQGTTASLCFPARTNE